MAVPALEFRVGTLEDYMRELAYQSMRTEMELAQLSKEMREFKTEMRVFKNEMGAFKNEMSAFKDEMGAFKDEMREFKNETERDRKRMNKQWGDLANRLGTLVEDIVAPNLPRIASELFGCQVPELFAVRVKRRFGADTREYDAMIVCDNQVLINETKSQLDSTHIDRIRATLEEFPAIFPEYAHKRPVGVLASLYPDESVVRAATRQGVLVMGLGDETMIALNPEAVRAKS